MKFKEGILNARCQQSHLALHIAVPHAGRVQKGGGPQHIQHHRLATPPPLQLAALRSPQRSVQVAALPRWVLVCGR